MEVDSSDAEDLSHALKRLLIKHEKNPPEFFEDWRAFTNKHGKTPHCVPFIDEDVIALLATYIQYTQWESNEYFTLLHIIHYIFLHYKVSHLTALSGILDTRSFVNPRAKCDLWVTVRVSGVKALKQSLDKVADQVFDFFPRLTFLVMETITAHANLGVEESISPFRGLISLLQNVSTSSDFYAKCYITSGSLLWTLSKLVLNDSILPNCSSVIIDFLDIVSEFSEEVHITLIFSHGLSFAQAISSSPSVILRFRLTQLLRKLVSGVQSNLLLKKAEEWFPRNSESFFNINTLQDVLNFAYSFENPQVTSHVCTRVSSQHLDRQYFLTPPLDFDKMWVDFDSKMKYLGFFCKPIRRKGVKVSEDVNAVFYIIIPEAVVERAEAKLIKSSASHKELQLTLSLRKELKELTDASIYPVRHSKILTVMVEYHASIIKLIQTVFTNMNIIWESLETARLHLADQFGSRDSTVCGVFVDVSESSLKQATMSISHSSNESNQHTDDVCASSSKTRVPSRQAPMESAQSRHDVPHPVMGEENKRSIVDEEGMQPIVGESTVANEEEKHNPFWYLEVLPPSPRRQYKKRSTKTHAAKNVGKSRKMKVNDNERLQAELNEIEKLFEKFSGNDVTKDEFTRKVELIHAEMGDICMQTGGHRWKEALREELATSKNQKGGPLVASFRAICRNIDQLDMDSWKRANSHINSENVALILAYFEEFSEIRREGAEFA